MTLVKNSYKRSVYLSEPNPAGPYFRHRQNMSV